MNKNIEIILNDEQKNILLNILRLQYPEYNKIILSHDNFIQMYKNYKPYQGWEDYGLNYEEYQKIHWFEFMVCELQLESDDSRNDYLDMIFKDKIHPIDAYKTLKTIQKI